MNVNEINIYVVTHKYFDRLLDKCFQIISVGDKLTNDKNCYYLKDNTMINISQKNKSFCELTAQYWIWKNDKNSLIKGLCHYRRYFSKNNKILNYKDIIEIFNKNKSEVIVPYKSFSIKTVEQVYLRSGYKKDLEIVRDVINKKYPEYIEEYDKILKSHASYPYNMIIAKGNIFDEYSKWLFDILFEAEKKIDITEYTNHEKRIYGFISERLLAVWLAKKNYKIYNLDVINTEQYEKNLKSKIKDFINKYQHCFIVKVNLNIAIKILESSDKYKKIWME